MGGHEETPRCTPVRKARIQCLLIDDGLGGVKEMGEEYQWHDRYTHNPTRRIVRVEVVAQVRV